MTDTDDNLLQRVKRGEDAAFECLFLRHYSQVYRVAYGLMGRREEAEDLAQETFLELHRNPPRLSNGGSLLAWLCRVALNRGYNSLRSERRAQERAERWAVRPEQVDPLAGVLRAEENARVREALAQLPERQNRLLLLRYAGLSYAEIASVLEVAHGSVGTLLARAEKAFVAAYSRTEAPGKEESVTNDTLH